MPPKKRTRVVVALVRSLLVVVALGYVAYIVRRDLPHLLPRILPLSPERAGWLCLSTILLAICPLLSIGVFRVLVQRYGDQPVRYRDCLKLVLLSNLLRHLPGRFFGVAYQVTTPLPGVNAANMLRVNVEQMLMSLAGNTIAAGGILWFGGGHLVAGALLFLAAAPAMVLMLNARLPGPLREWLRENGPERLRKLAIDEPRIVRLRSFWLAALLNLSSWAPYLLAWHLLSRVFPMLGDQPLALLGASYSIGWAAGTLSLITPSGLGVREAVFLLVSPARATTEALALITIFGRVWQLLGDVVAWLLFATFLPALLVKPNRTVSS
jgi:hypothetical protein